MRRFLPAFLGAILLGTLLGLPAHAQEQPSTRSVLRLVPGAGYFLYSQHVDGGYSINGRAYDLVWSGLQLQLAGDLHWQFVNHPFLALGLAGAFMIAPNATGADWERTVSVDPDKLALGGYLAFSACFRPNDRWQLLVQTGLGNDGISGALGFGGWGLMSGGAVHRMLGRGSLLSGVGLRLNAMALVSSRDGMVRGESGVYASLLLEFLFELAHDVLLDQGGAAPQDGQGGGASRDQP